MASGLALFLLWGSGFRVKGFGLGFRVQGSGFRVEADLVQSLGSKRGSRLTVQLQKGLGFCGSKSMYQLQDAGALRAKRPSKP